MEIRELRTKLELQHGIYEFPKGIEVGVKYPGEAPSKVKVRGAYIVDPIEDDTIFLDVRFEDKQTGAIKEFETVLYPGEWLRIADAIPDYYIDPDELERYWNNLNGQHVVTDCYNANVIISFDGISKKVWCDYDGHKYEWDAEESDYHMRLAVMNLKRLSSWDDLAPKKQAERLAQDFFDQTGISLPVRKTREAA